MANAQQQLQAALTEFKNAQRGKLSSLFIIIQNQVVKSFIAMACLFVLKKVWQSMQFVSLVESRVKIKE